MNIFLNILFSILVAIVVLLILLMVPKATVIANLKKPKGEKTETSAYIYIWGGIIKLDLLASTRKKKALIEAGEIAEISLLEKLKAYYGNLPEFMPEYRRWAGRVRKTVLAKKLYVNLQFGLGDAAKTGMATGEIWAAIYGIIAFVSNIIRITEPKIQVTPNYNELMCDAEAECIIKARLYNFLIVDILWNKLFKIKENKINNKKGGD